MILVSSCLLGLACRYDGRGKRYPQVEAYLKDKDYLPVCPEQMGGLSTPRLPCEIVSESPLKIASKCGLDCTEAFLKGVEEVEKLMDHRIIDMAILKGKSPSCGAKQIYNGSFNRVLVQGQGVLARMLSSKGIEILNEEDL